MIHFINRILILLVVMGLAAGCSAKREASHTHLWIGDQQQNVWSYLRVEKYVAAEDAVEEKVFDEEALLGEFVSKKLSAGDKVTFPGDVEVTFDGTSLFVNGDKVEEKHVQIEANGTLRRNAFIKTAN